MVGAHSSRMNALLPEFQTCLVRRYQASFHPGYWSFVDKQINLFSNQRLLRSSAGKPSKGMVLPGDRCCFPGMTIIYYSEKNNPSICTFMKWGVCHPQMPFCVLAKKLFCLPCATTKGLHEPKGHYCMYWYILPYRSVTHTADNFCFRCMRFFMILSLHPLIAVSLSQPLLTCL